MIASIVSLMAELRAHPFLMALVIVNALFISAVVVTLREVSDGLERRDILISHMVDELHKPCP